MLTITEMAAMKIRGLLDAEKKPGDFGLRVGIAGGGCSGLQYVMDFDTEKSGDSTFTQDGVKVFVDPKSLLYMDGSVLDYIESLQGAGFTIRNPMQSGGCGCGKSFSV